MKLSALHQIHVLEQRRRVLMGFRDHMELIARVRTGTGLGASTENLDPALIAQLEPIVRTDFARAVTEIERQMSDLGVEVDTPAEVANECCASEHDPVT